VNYRLLVAAPERGEAALSRYVQQLEQQIATQTLRGVRVVTLALNLPGPAAIMRLAQMGASCTKVNPRVGRFTQTKSFATCASSAGFCREVSGFARDAPSR
jgi:hypothetical protein